MASLQGRQLADVINERHENVVYFPGVALPENVVADPDIRAVAADADVLVICIPHQFIKPVRVPLTFP